MVRLPDAPDTATKPDAAAPVSIESTREEGSRWGESLTSIENEAMPLGKTEAGLTGRVC